MAQTGTVIYRSDEIIQNQKIIANAAYTKFSLIRYSGAWPTVSYKINTVSIRYTKRTVGYSDISYWKLDSLTSSNGIYLGTSGSYWTGEGNNIMSTRDTTVYTGDTFYLGIYADNSGVSYSEYNPGTGSTTVIVAPGGDGGQILGGTRIYLEIVWELTETPSTFTVTPSAVDFGGTVTVDITPGLGVTNHTIRFVFGTIGSSDNDWEVVTGTTFSKEIPIEWAAQIPDTTTGRIKVQLGSLNGSRIIGITEKYFDVFVPSGVTPSADDISVSVAPEPGTFINLQNEYIQRITKARFTVSAQGIYGSNITSLTVSGNNVLDNVPVTPASSVSKVVVSDALSTYGNNTYTITATDSRGRSISKTATINVKEYAFPAIGVTTVERCDSNGTPVPAGESLLLTTTFTWTSTGISGNQLVTKAYWRLRGASNWQPSEGSADISITGNQKSSILLNWGDTSMSFSKNNAYDILFEVSDTASELVNKKASILIEVSTGEAYLVMQRKEGLKIPKLGVGTYPSEQTPDVSAVYINEEWELYTHGMEIRKLILDTVYPIGSIYISMNNTNPSTIIGGTWEQIEGRFLLAANNTYSAGDEGGSASHTLTEAELPTSGNWAFPMIKNIQGQAGTQQTDTNISATGSFYTFGSSSGFSDLKIAGGGNAFSIMPPYLAVYMWKRVSDPETT